MGAPINIQVNVWNVPELNKLPEKVRTKTVEKTEKVAQAIAQGSKQVVVNTVRLSKKMLIKLLTEVLPSVALKVIKIIPGLLILAVA